MSDVSPQQALELQVAHLMADVDHLWTVVRERVESAHLHDVAYITGETKFARERVRMALTMLSEDGSLPPNG